MNTLLRFAIGLALLSLKLPYWIVQGINTRIVWIRAVLEAERMKL